MSLPQQHSAGRIHRAVAEHLAIDEAELRERVAELERERESYRQLLQHALDQFHDLTARERARERRVRRLLDENAKLRSQVQRAA